MRFGGGGLLGSRWRRNELEDRGVEVVMKNEKSDIRNGTSTRRRGTWDRSTSQIEIGTIVFERLDII